MGRLVNKLMGLPNDDNTPQNRLLQRIYSNPIGTETMTSVSNPAPAAGGLWQYQDPQAWAQKVLSDPLVMGMATGGEAPGGPIRAFHGSPHSFDHFDMSKIGTGEGAQAYGHGLYFAGNEGVARGYRDALSKPPLPMPAPHLILSDLQSGAAPVGGPIAPILAQGMSDGLWQASNTPAKAAANIAHIENGIRSPNLGLSPEQQNHAIGVLKNWSESTLKPPGYMYEVALHTDPSRLLDWDKPLSAQPAPVRDALLGSNGVVQDIRSNPYAMEHLEPHINGEFDNLTGAEFHTVLKRLAEQDLLPTNGPGVDVAMDAGHHPAAASSFLRNEGIHGIQYLDAGSRGAGQGTSNYVVFHPDTIEILRKYGILPPVAGGAAALTNKLTGQQGGDQ